MMYKLVKKDDLLYVEGINKNRDMALERVLYIEDFESLFIDTDLDLFTLQHLERKVFSFIEYMEFPKIGKIKLRENFIKAVSVEEDMKFIGDEIDRYLEEVYKSKVRIISYEMNDWIMYGIIRCGEQYNVKNVIDHVKGLIDALYELRTFIKHSIKDLEDKDNYNIDNIFVPAWFNHINGPDIFFED